MKFNKILMSTLVGCALLTPIILSSCSIKNSGTSSNNEEQKPKTIPVPFQSSLYDTWDPASDTLTFGCFNNPTYEIPNVEEWFNNESNNGRNYYKSTNPINDEVYDFYACDNDSTSKPVSSNPLFKTIDKFYTWIRKSENNYEVSLQAPNENIEDKLFNFNIFNWNFITNPNCDISIYIYIYTHNYDSNVITNTKYIWKVEIQTYPRIGYEWQINRYDDNGNYNNRRTIIFEFYFDNLTSTNQ